MKNFFDLSITQGDGMGFSLFGSAHLCWIAGAVLLICTLCFAYRSSSGRVRRKLSRLTALLCLLIELSTAAFMLSRGFYGIQTLPLHLCGLAVYLTAFHSLRGGRLLGEFLYALCMPGAFFAVLFPDWAYYPPFHVITLSSFFLHILLAAYPAMSVCAGEIKPRPSHCPKLLGIMLLIAVPVYFFNIYFGTNYMFLSYPSPGSPLEWFAFLGRPGYILGYLPILAVVWGLLYLPFWKKSF